MRTQTDCSAEMLAVPSGLNDPIKVVKVPRTVRFESNKLILLDQRLLPQKLKFVSASSVHDTAVAIRDMIVRGAPGKFLFRALCMFSPSLFVLPLAPAIGAAAGYGMVLGAFAADSAESSSFLQCLQKAKQELDSARPTAVNLTWATSRILAVAEALCSSSPNFPLSVLRAHLLEEAHHLADDDVARNTRLSHIGSTLVLPLRRLSTGPDNSRRRINILHHCNTGALATVGETGTALGV